MKYWDGSKPFVISIFFGMKTLFEVPPVHLKGVSLQVWDCQWLGGLAVSILRRRKS
jgi:hypothetical protein